MTELSDVIPQPEPGVSLRRARVISANGPTVTVDMGGSPAGITIERAAGCFPVPNQYVLIMVDGLTMVAVAAIGGVWKQSAVTVTSVSEVAVGGIVNGIPWNVAKFGAFTPAVGDTLPLVWSATGDSVWAGPKPGVPYVPPPVAPPPSGGGGGGGGGTISSGTATYPATDSGQYNNFENRWRAPSVGHNPDTKGCYFYGGGRFRELQGRTITGFRINISIEGGSSTVSYYTHGYGSKPGGEPAFTNGPFTITGSGWLALPVSWAYWLIGGSGTGGIGVFGPPNGSLRGLPYGTLQFDWRR